MNRWHNRRNEKVELPAIDAFLVEVDDVCRAHGFSISHEDGFGSFIIETYADSDSEWMSNAGIGKTVQ